MTWRSFIQILVLVVVGSALLLGTVIYENERGKPEVTINAEPGATVLVNPYYVTGSGSPIILDTKGQTIRSLPDPEK
jgi:hypothetical protein